MFKKRRTFEFTNMSRQIWVFFQVRCFWWFLTPVPICKCISVSDLVSLHFPHSQLFYSGLPGARANERISIWKEWILDCAPTDGWIRRDRASFQQDLHWRFTDCLRRGRSKGGNGWVHTGVKTRATVMKCQASVWKKKIVLCDVAFDTNINLHEK